MINIPSTKNPFPPKLSVWGAASLFAIASTGFGATEANAATANSNLTFNISARIASTSADGKTSGPSQNYNAKVSLAGKKARIDSGEGKSRSVLLLSSPYVYRLLPTYKAGIRWQMSAKEGASFRDFDPQQMLSSPRQIRSSLIQFGAKRIGSSILGSTPVDIYEVKKPGERLSYAKAWIGRSNALPYRLEAKGQGMNIVASWNNYARPSKLPASLFAPPTGYRIRNVASRPPLSGM